MSKHTINPEHTTNLSVPAPRGWYEGRHRKLWMDPTDAEELGIAGLLFVAAAWIGWMGVALLR